MVGAQVAEHTMVDATGRCFHYYVPINLLCWLKLEAGEWWNVLTMLMILIAFLGDVALSSTVKSSLYNNVQALLRETDSGSASQTGNNN